MIRVLLSAPLCLHIRLSSRFTCWPEIWIVPVSARFLVTRPTVLALLLVVPPAPQLALLLLGDITTPTRDTGGRGPLQRGADASGRVP